jgi:hypothetical protein
MPVVTTKAPKPVDPNEAQSQAPSLPYAQPNQLLNVVKPVQPKTTTVTNTTQGNTAVMQTAQQEALNAQNKPNETMGLVQQGVQNLLKNPLGYDKNSYTQNQLEQYDRNRSNAMSAFQQSNADTSNTGLNLEKAYNYAMQGAQGRSDLENTQRMEQATKEREAMLSALTAGTNVSQTQSGLDEASYNRLLNARNAMEGERSQAQGQTNAKELQTLGHTQNLETLGVQQGYNKELETLGYNQDVQKMAIQNGYDLNKLDATFGHDKAMAILNGDISMNAQQAQNEYDNTQRIATQAWQTGERLSTEDYQKATNYYDWAMKNAAQKNDLEGQKTLQDMKAKTDLAMQTNEMDQQTKMAYLNNELATAKANGDVDRQKNIISFQTTQDLNKLYEEGKVSEAKQVLQGKIDQALKDSDHVSAEALQTSGYIFQAQENAKDRALKQAGVNLDAIAEAEKNGQIAAGSLEKFMNSAMANLGITVSVPSSMETSNELVQQFKETKMQWAMSHPEALADPADPTKGLNDSGEKSFNEFYNSTLYNDQDFGSSAYKPIAWSGDASPTNDKAFATMPPAIGSFIRYRGFTMKVTSDVTADQSAAGGGLLQFTAVDTKTGQTHTIKAGNEGN